MKVSLDTCGYSRLALQSQPLVDMLAEADAVYLSSVMLGELFAGFCLGSREMENRRELARFLDLPGVEVVDITSAIADRYGILVKQLRQQGTPLPTNDIWIAASAFETGSRLVTYDSHFDSIQGLLIVAP
jgi:tRNA(fMet)-specific endonuclease VapC